jgi:CheY-like chemotaxis protein
VQQILALGRRNEQETKVVALGPVVQEAVDLLAATIPATIQVRHRIDSGGGNVLADATQIHQVVMNLCTNAFQAMETSGGVLEITLRRVDVDEETAATRPGLRAGPYSQLVVRDTGPGMDPAIRERIFDPFFTTKPVGVGTGLGLSVAHGIISRHGGVILCRSELGQGTSFEVYLPLVSDEVAEPARLPEPLPRGTERILFVDDEKAIVSMVEKLLTRLDYLVTGRVSSVEALALFEQSAGAFDLLITDVTMPELSDPELVTRVLAKRGDMPIIMVTGFSAQTTSESVRKLGAEALLYKPFSTADLARTVRDVLDKARL